MKWFQRERPEPREVPMSEQAGAVLQEASAEGYNKTEEGDAAREYLKKWPDEAPHRRAIETMAYVAIPEFAQAHPDQSMAPGDIIPNREFNDIRTKLAESFGVHGAIVAISDEDVKMALALAQEYLANQKEGVDTGEESVAAA